MKKQCLQHKTCLPKAKRRESCASCPDIFSHMRLIKDEEWKDIKFLDEDSKLSSVLVVAKTEPEPFEGFYIRRWDHPYEPNFETRTYNLLEFCQQKKVKNFFETGKAGNLIVWTRDEKTGKLYFIGAYEGIQKLRKIEGYSGGKWKSRTALMASEAYVAPHGKGIPMKDFTNEFRRRSLAFPSQKKLSPYHSCYGYYVIDKELTESLMNVIKKNAVGSKTYGKLTKTHTRSMLKKLKEITEINKKRHRKLNIDKFQKRFVTKPEMRYAKKMRIF